MPIKVVEKLFMRFEVELNMQPSKNDHLDDGAARAAEVKQALLETVQDFDIEGTVTETTE